MSRLADIERVLGRLVRAAESASSAVDETRAARTALLSEKTVTEAVQEALAARTAAAKAARRARKAQRRVAAHLEAESAASVRAAVALEQALAARGSQLDELLVPGSPPADEDESGTRRDDQGD